MRRAIALLVPLAGLVFVVAGIALMYLPAGMIATGVAILAVATFDPGKAGRITWPR
jgi:hypothetical protein